LFPIMTQQRISSLLYDATESTPVMLLLEPVFPRN
jgi:hypothetical protein